MDKHYKGEIILLRENLLKASIVNVLEDKNKYLVSYYIKNKIKHKVVDDSQILNEEEYEKIRYRNNLINKLL